LTNSVLVTGMSESNLFAHVVKKSPVARED